MKHPDIECRMMAPGEEAAVLALVTRSFDEFVRPDFSEAGVSEFLRASREFVLDHPPGHRISVAVRDGALVGMIDIRDCSHVAHFFVDPPYLGEGIGRLLFGHAIEDCREECPDFESLTVHSSPWAVPVYGALGFVATGPEAEVDGIRSVPMTWRLPGRG